MFAKAVTYHIPHAHTAEMEEKSEVVGYQHTEHSGN
jgi:hypothetical protein